MSRRPLLLSPVRWLAFLALVVSAVLLQFLPSTTQVVVTEIAQPPKPEATSVALSVYSEAIAGRPRDINPLLSDTNDADQDLAALIFSGLTATNASGQSGPALALSWDVSADGLEYTFALRSDAKWHDGTPFTSRDVSATLSLLRAPEFPAPAALSDLWRKVSVETSGDYTVTFILSEPYTPFLAQTSLGLLPAHVVEKIPPSQWSDPNFKLRPIGTGPYRLTRLDPGRGVAVLEAFRDFYGPRPSIQRLELRFYASHPSTIAAYQRGEVMGIARVPADLAQTARGLESVALYAAPMHGFGVLYLNLRMPLFQQKELRRALLLALDRQRLIDRVQEGQGLVAISPLLPTHWANNRFVSRHEPDIAAAKEMLARIGWLDSDGDGVLDREGAKLEFAIMSSDAPAHIRMIEEVSRQWEGLGVRAHTQTTGFSGLVRDFLRPRRFEAVYVEWHDPSADPDMYPLWHSTRVADEGQNYAGWVNREADEVLEQARRVSDPRQRADLYAKFQDLFAEQTPAILIGYPVYVYAVHRRVRNVQVGTLTRPSDRFQNIASWSVMPSEGETGGAVPRRSPP